MFKKLIGSKQFYKNVLTLMIPIMIQNGITNFVNMLDNVMVGRIGTVEMNGVAVANQLIFVFNLCIFGAVSGAGIFSAQYHGSGDREGVRDTFRFKVVSCLLLTLLGIGVFLGFGNTLSGLYLRGEGDPAEAAAALAFSRQYMLVMLIGLIPYTIVQCYSSTLRETGKAKIPMYAGLLAVSVNLCLNYVLIFGHFGAPKLGVVGAAIATVTSRFVELAFIAGWTDKHKSENPFIIGAFASLRVPKKLTKEIILRGLPLMLNETMWAMGMAFLNQCYSSRSLNVVGANNISSTFWNVFSVAFMAVGAAIGIILGQVLGAGKKEEARDTSWKLIAFSVTVSVVVGVVYFFAAEFIPQFYNTTDEIRLLATRIMQITAICMPLDAFANACYFTLRSGGQVMITILFDSCFVWVINIPVVLVLTYLTAMPILPLYAISQCLPLLKCCLGFVFVKKGIWIKNIVSEQA